MLMKVAPLWWGGAFYQYNNKKKRIQKGSSNLKQVLTSSLSMNKPNKNKNNSLLNRVSHK